jgi:hypothetical protein
MPTALPLLAFGTGLSVVGLVVLLVVVLIVLRLFHVI